MYVRKFESETLDGALSAIKKELGPDAIILKTVTNKGIKGAFKKNKIEITAAISEKNYTKKAKVDNVLSGDEQERFYQNNASYVSNMIDSHSLSDEKINRSNRPGYGKAGLNRSVVQKDRMKETNLTAKSKLDDFLQSRENPKEMQREKFQKEEVHHLGKNEMDGLANKEISMGENEYKENERYGQNQITLNSETNEKLILELRKAKDRIDELEKNFYLFSKEVERLDKKEPIGLYQLRNTLSSLNIGHKFLHGIIKKATFEHSVDQLENIDVIFEFALREMMESINVELPLFSSVDLKSENTITIHLSELSCGQSSMIQKTAALNKKSIIVKYDDRENDHLRKEAGFASKFFNMEIIDVSSIAEIVSECRKASEVGKSIFIDYRISTKEENKTKKFIDGIKRSFANVEVFICLSAIQSELYNMSVCNKYNGLADGIVVSNMDSCLNFGALFNITDQFKGLPYKFFGTGEMIPNDIEPASAERILSGIFKFN